MIAFDLQAYRLPHRATRLAVAATLLLLIVAVPRDLPSAESRAEQSPPWVRQLYETNCAMCHGVDGDGNGLMAHMLVTRPRDFRTGVYKFRSTPSGSLPTDADLLRTLREGLRWTAMIARPDLSESDRMALVQYIKSFSPRFASETPGKPVIVPKAPVRTVALTSEGAKLYREADCVSCHGETGQGDGKSARELKDDWGWPILPSNLTWRPLKRGSSLEQIYLTIATGASGTPMPSFGDALSADQIWSLVYFLDSLVPPDQRLPERRRLGEEQQGQMMLHMGAMGGRGMMMRGRR